MRFLTMKCSHIFVIYWNWRRQLACLLQMADHKQLNNAFKEWNQFCVVTNIMLVNCNKTIKNKAVGAKFCHTYGIVFTSLFRHSYWKILFNHSCSEYSKFPVLTLHSPILNKIESLELSYKKFTFQYVSVVLEDYSDFLFVLNHS